MIEIINPSIALIDFIIANENEQIMSYFQHNHSKSRKRKEKKKKCIWPKLKVKKKFKFVKFR